jgi:glycosyltransferase involved in cell wall biosynthesis
LTVVRPVEGGIQAHVLNLLANMKDDFAFTVACPKEQAPRFREEGCEVVALPIGRGLQPYRDLRTAGHLYSMLKSGQYELVHAHGFKAAMLARLPARLTGLPCLVTVHGDLAYGNQGALGRFYRRSERIFSCWTCGYITVSQWLAEHLRTSFGVPAGRITVIPNGIDAHEERANGAPLPFADDVILVGTVARLAPQKGVAYFLQAAKQIVSCLPDIRFVVVGDGPLRSELEDLCRKLDIEGYVAFTGYRYDVPALLRRFCVFVLPSLSEGQGITVLEAMAAGCPVVASDIGGLRELVKHGKTGLLVEAGNVNELSDAVTRLLQDSLLRQELAERGKANVLQYQMGEMIQQTKNVYHRILEGRCIS